MPGSVLSVASECVPLLKTGGLADVVGALPKAMAEQGWDMRVLMPAYPGMLEKLGPTEQVLADQSIYGFPVRVRAGRIDGINILLVDAPHMYDRAGGPYGNADGDYHDNPERFATLCMAASAIARDGLSDGWSPDVVHAHDWQGGLVPAYLRYGGPSHVKTVLTVHNIAFQGMAPADRLGTLNLPVADFTDDKLEYYGQISTLKAGLVAADAITTVSPTYAAELMRPEFGLGLQGVIESRAADLSGILNGVDVEVWSPEKDPGITPYSSDDMVGKARNRAALLQEFGLGDVPGPLAIVVSRLTSQKGIDLIPGVLNDFVARGGGLIVLGSGDHGLERAMQNAARAHPGRIGVRIGYDEALSHRMFAGGDAVLVPSRFEPCGLTQMYGLRYGTLPLVAATGGLADTVIDANPAALNAGVATGIAFHPTDGLAFEQAMRRLSTLYADKPTWQSMQANAMASRVDWSRSAAAYQALYESLLTR